MDPLYLPPLLILTTLGYLAFAFVSSRREMHRRAGARNPDSPHAPARLILAGGSPATVMHPPNVAVKFILAGAAPATVAIMAAAIFYIPHYLKNGVTTVQFTLGSSAYVKGMSTWSTLCPVLLPITAVSALGSLIWLMDCAYHERLRRQIPAAFFSILFSVLGFVTAAFILLTATV